VPRSGRLRPPRYQWVASPHLCASAHRPPTRGRSGSVPLVVVAPPARPLRGRHRWDHNTHTYTAEASDVPFCPSRPQSRRSTAVTPPERASDHCGAGHGVSRPSRPRAPSRSNARRDSGSRKSVRATLRLRAWRAGPYLRKPCTKKGGLGGTQHSVWSGERNSWEQRQVLNPFRHHVPKKGGTLERHVIQVRVNGLLEFRYDRRGSCPPANRAGLG